ncbi:hypothetical protein ABI066_16150, partial [Enterococcus faecium]|uniref:hypothetical protein n=1 Tax=Enterococcus faecium TaxID=1352 RepID=UPI003F4312A9
RALVARFGAGGFDYAGDAFADLPVWAKARRAIVVAPTPRLLARVRARHGEVDVVGVAGPRVPAGAAWRSLRPHQWAKNALLLMPP